MPTTHPQLAEVESAAPVDVFKATARYDVLLHHPYDSFATSVQRFLEQAAADPHVLAIKQTLYRTSGDSPIIDALVDAAEAGKQVLVIVEIKARFDEEANIRWARKLEQAGCHVVYGLVGLKTHCKLSMVVRDEPEGIRRYTHIGTGNYNGKTARMYEDLGLITTNEVIGEDVAHLFNNLSGYSRNPTLRAAPGGARLRAHRPGRADPPRDRPPRQRPPGPDPDQGQLRSSTRRSSTRSTSPRRPAYPWRCWCAAICALRPGVPGLSENIAVRSILGRFLEHSRVYWFENGGEPERLDRVGRPHAPQPRPPGRGAGAAARRGQRRPGRRRCSTWRSRPRRTPGSCAATASGSPTTGPTISRRSLIEQQRRRREAT